MDSPYAPIVKFPKEFSHGSSLGTGWQPDLLIGPQWPEIFGVVEQRGKKFWDFFLRIFFCSIETQTYLWTIFWARRSHLDVSSSHLKLYTKSWRHWNKKLKKCLMFVNSTDIEDSENSQLTNPQSVTVETVIRENDQKTVLKPLSMHISLNNPTIIREKDSRFIRSYTVRSVR